MLTASATVDPGFRVGPVNRRLFGSFVEHLGRCVYTGVFEPGHPSADSDGFRTDVLELAREMGVSVVRYPGGNFVSAYRWEDGVGPVQQRPVRRDLAWHSLETNEFGLGEFLRWTAAADAEPMLAVNLGTRGVTEALELQEYANHPGGTYWSDLRKSHGAAEPYGIRMWCLGNEMDGPWQTGHKTALEYGRLAAETARAMRQAEPDLELVACGSSGASMPTFGEWEAVVLGEAYEMVDYISLHSYYWETDGDLASFLASAVDMDRFIEAVVATADHVRARRRASKRIQLSFDEWNVWYLDAHQAKPPPAGWERAPRLLEDVYSVADAVVVGGLLISLLRHADRVTAACQAQLVNVIGPIMSEPGGPAWRQATFHPFAVTSRWARGEVLRVEPVAPLLPTAKYGEVPVLDAVATSDGDEVAVFAVNRHAAEPVVLEVDLRAWPGARLAGTVAITDPDVYATNSRDEPDRVVPRPLAEASVEGGRLRAVLPAVCWAALRLTAH